MTDEPLRTRVGSLYRAAREDAGLSQRELAVRAGVSKSLIARIECGGPGASLESLDRIAHGLEAEVAFGLRLPIAAGTRDAVSRDAVSRDAVSRDARSGDAAHARGLGALQRALERRSLETLVEQRVAVGPVRGWIDLLAFDRRIRRLIVIEFKTRLSDLGALDRQVEVYARGCMQPALAAGWHPIEVLVIVAVLATAEVDAVVSANRELLSESYPMRGQAAVRALLDGGPIGGRGLVLFDPLRSGRRAFTPSRSDGRRSAAPYRDYAEFMRVLDVIGPRRRRPPVTPGG